MTNGQNPALHSVFVLQLCVTPITTAIATATLSAQTDALSWAASVLLMIDSPVHTGRQTAVSSTR